MDKLEILKKRINGLVKEEVSRRNNKVDLSKVFDLSKIPADELRRRYVDLSLVNYTSGFGSCLFKDNGEYINENDSRVRNAYEVQREISMKYFLGPWQFDVIECGHDIQVCICIANIKQSVQSIINDLNQMGYFLSFSETSSDYMGQVWAKLQFEPKYQMNDANTILSYGDLYHLTPSYNLPEIEKNGLVPSCKNGKFNYPNRIYLLIGNIPIQEIGEMGLRLCQNNKDPRNNGEYTLLKIDSSGLYDKIELYHDPNYKYGAFCNDKIDKELISKFNEYKYTKILKK